MPLDQVLEELEKGETARHVTCWRTLPGRPARPGPFPSWLHPSLAEALRRRGIRDLYTHQAKALEALGRGENVVVVTPTASGKTLCYNVPVVDQVLSDSSTRALYLFPTKALAQDQLAELQELCGTELRLRAYTYDGDTPQSARGAIRSAGHIVVTNPDMLHTGILPHHTKWLRLFQHLRYVVVDEVHQYRGVFGSHLANVIRRLKRVARFYGTRPQFICCSATIANPAELAVRLIEEPITLIDDNGAPSGPKHFILYNPPVVNRELGIRRSSVLEAAALASRFLRAGVQTLVFARSRLATEVLVTYLKRAAATVLPGQGEAAVRGYRGGYLPLQRREIEQGLREGRVRAAVSTNALELGIDIGQLDAVVMAGYPGSIASAWQQAGRAGRRTDLSAAVLVADSSPLNQYLVNHPDYFFGRSPEHGLVNPDNPFILANHLKCAAFELPFEDGEGFGQAEIGSVLEQLACHGLLHHSGGRWHWMADSYPAEDLSLRSASAENFVVIDVTGPAPRVIGEVDRSSAPMLLHEEAIYLNEADQYQVEKLDYQEKKAFVRRVEVDYYTDASLAVDIKVLARFQHDLAEGLPRSSGEVLVSALPTMFKKIRFGTHENVGSGPIRLPEEQMHTTAYWFSVPPEIGDSLRPEELEAGLLGIANLLVHMAPLYLLCDVRDIRSVVQVRSPFTGLPTVYVYDRYPGGVGFADKLYELHRELLAACRDLAGSCACAEGCPSCVGPGAEVGPGGRRAALRILRAGAGLLRSEAFDGEA
ncbi:MAG: DEAD/DEAH box helicase [bacterium]|nr:DEAD/DEAH box helicase [bacterium]